MAEEIDPKQLAGVIRGLNKSAKGRRVLQQAMREAGITGGGGVDDRDKFINEAYAKGKESAAAQGKGMFGQFRAGMKAAKEIDEQYQLATLGTKQSREKILRMFGIQVGNTFRKNLEKRGTKEEIEKAKELFKIEKKSKEQGGGSSDRAEGKSAVTGSTNRVQKLIALNVLDIKKMVKNIQTSLSGKTKLKPGIKFDPNIGSSGGYRYTSGEKKGKFVSAKEALTIERKGIADKKNEARTLALTKAIGADEDPMLKIADTLDAVMKSLGTDNKTVHEKLDEIKNSSGGGGFGIPGLGMARGAARLLSRTGSAVARGARAVGGAAARVGGRVAGALALKSAAVGGRAVAAKAAASAGKEAIQAAARKVLKSSIVRGVGKAIPLAGLAVGGFFAAKKLLSGDFVGAGLEVAGAAGGPLTAVPATVASAVRDIYQSVYGIYPETDPEAPKRLDEVRKVTTDIASEMLGGDKKDDKAQNAPAAKSAPAAAAPKPPTSPPPAQPKSSGPSFISRAGSAISSAASSVGSAISGAASSAGSFASSAASAVGSAIGDAASSVGSAIGGAASGIMGTISTAMQESGLSNKFAQVALLANIKKESGFKPKSENLKYGGTSNDRIRSIFGKRAARYSDAELNVIKKDEYKMGELMYGKDTRMGQSMGNKEEGDGFKYRGRGFIQLTGKNNYAAYGKQIGVDLVGNPDLANDPVIAAKIAARFIMTGLKNKINFTDQKSANMAVTKVIGGSLDLSKGYGAEILAKVDRYANELSGGVPAGPGAGSGAMMASASVGSAPSSAAPAPQPASASAASTSQPALASASSPAPLQPKQSVVGPTMSAASDQYSQSQMVAQNAPPPAPVVVAAGSGGGGAAAGAAQPKQQLPKAPTRTEDSSFMRALARDFAHPTAFTTVSMV